MAKYPEMIKYVPFYSAISGKVFYPEMYVNCLQLQMTSEKISDIYDFNTGKHIMRVEL